MKTDLAENVISRSFKVNHFRIFNKPIRNFMTPRNNIGFTEKAAEITKNRRF